MGEILLGTSGWSYREWIGPLYQTEGERKLSTYINIFKTVEINSTFYAYPSKGIVFGWMRVAKPDFTFTAKVPKLITHEKALDLDKGVERDLKAFCSLLKPLKVSGKLGPLLIQLPPSFDYKPKLLEAFLQILPKHYRFAVEFRNRSWMRAETWKLLEGYDVAYTIVDEPLLPPEIHITTDFAYMRWHGRGKRPWFNYCYSLEELEEWVPRVKEISQGTERVYGYFNNHFHGYAVENCLQILKMLEPLTQAQESALERSHAHIEGVIKERKAKRGMLISLEEMGVRDLLPAFMDRKRLRRAEGIRDEDLTLKEVSEERIEAQIRRYLAIIDSRGRRILHDCDDWRKRAPSKVFCKHLGKIFLSIPEDIAIPLLKEIYRDRESWRFESP